MVKPWTVATDDSYVWQAFQDKKCPGPQEHPVNQRVEGKHTKGTEDYTPEMVNMIHRSWKRSVMSSVKSKRLDEVIIPVMPIDRNQ
eukprot:7023805-Heterocapsa_arctica.AAC.1